MRSLYLIFLFLFISISLAAQKKAKLPPAVTFEGVNVVRLNAKYNLKYGIDTAYYRISFKIASLKTDSAYIHEFGYVTANQSISYFSPTPSIQIFSKNKTELLKKIKVEDINSTMGAAENVLPDLKEFPSYGRVERVKQPGFEEKLQNILNSNFPGGELRTDNHVAIIIYTVYKKLPPVLNGPVGYVALKITYPSALKGSINAKFEISVLAKECKLKDSELRDAEDAIKGAATLFLNDFVNQLK